MPGPIPSSLLAALTGDPAIEALFSDDADLDAMLIFETALAAAQAECGLVPPEAAGKIAAVAERFVVDRERLAAAMRRDGVAGPDFVAQLKQAVGDPFGRFVHFAATSQDVVDTSLVLRLQQTAAVLGDRLESFVGDLKGLAKAQGAVPLMAHTRMQQALPITAADKIAAWRAPLERHLERLEALGPRVFVVQFGGPVGTRSDLEGEGDAVAAALARRLGLHDGPCWHTARDGIAEFAGWLALVASSLGKIGQDLALLAQNEVGAVKIAGGGGSSAMKHKSNPVGAEVLVALARFAAGLEGTLAQGLVHEYERSGAAWTLEWLTLPPLAAAAGAALSHARDLVGRLTFAPTA